MVKTLSNILRQDREKFVIPRSVQQAIPIHAAWADGIFKVGRSKFARSYKFTDINYAVAGREDKEAMFLEYSELLGKSTIDTNTYGKSTGHSGSYSTNYQNAGRELMTPDEVRMLDNRYALLFIRGERPVMDEKFDILKHPNVGLSADGKGKPYRHGEVTVAVAGITLGDSLAGEITQGPAGKCLCELLSEEELEAIISDDENR